MTATPAARPVARPARRLSPGYLVRRGALVAFAALLIGLAATYIGLLASGELSVKKADYIVFYAAAKLILAGHGGALYDFRVLARTERAVVSPYTLRYGVLPFIYPPYFAVVFVPLALLPYTASFLVWLAANVAMLAASLRALVRYARLRREDGLLFVLAAVSFLPVLVCLIQGQTSILILASLTAGFFALRAGRDWTAGLCLALALTKPPYLVPLILMLAVRGRWRAAGGFVAGFAALVLLPPLLLGTGVDSAYLRTLQEATAWHSQFGYGPRTNESLLGSLQLLLPAGIATPAAVGLDLLLLAGLVVASRRASDLDVPYALAVLVGLLISPHVLIHDLALVILPAGIALRRAPGRTLVWILAAGYAAAAVGLQLATILPVQWMVIATAALACYLFARTAPGSRFQDQPAEAPLAVTER